MKIPKKVKVGGYTYQVIFDDLIDANDNDGICKVDKQLIALRPGMAQNHTEQVFLHELLHACFHHIGFDENYKYTEEQLVTELALVLHQVLKDNFSVCLSEKQKKDGIGVRKGHTAPAKKPSK